MDACHLVVAAVFSHPLLQVEMLVAIVLLAIGCVAVFADLLSIRRSLFEQIAVAGFLGPTAYHTPLLFIISFAFLIHVLI